MKKERTIKEKVKVKARRAEKCPERERIAASRRRARGKAKVEREDPVTAVIACV